MQNPPSLEIKKEELAETKIHSYCTNCERETNSDILSSYNLVGQQDCGNGNTFDWHEHYQIVKCRGCDTVSFRKTHTNSEDMDYDYDHNGETVTTYTITENLYPERKTERPSIKDFHLLPAQLQDIYKEAITAINSNLPILTGIGVRAILEMVCKDKHTVGKNLFARINELVTMGVISQSGVEILHQLRTLGNDSAHEVKPHSNLQLSLALEVIDNLLLSVYVLPHHSKSAFPKSVNS